MDHPVTDGAWHRNRVRFGVAEQRNLLHMGRALFMGLPRIFCGNYLDTHREARLSR